MLQLNVKNKILDNYNLNITNILRLINEKEEFINRKKEVYLGGFIFEENNDIIPGLECCNTIPNGLDKPGDFEKCIYIKPKNKKIVPAEDILSLKNSHTANCKVHPDDIIILSFMIRYGKLESYQNGRIELEVIKLEKLKYGVKIICLVKSVNYEMISEKMHPGFQGFIQENSKILERPVPYQIFVGDLSESNITNLIESSEIKKLASDENKINLYPDPIFTEKEEFSSFYFHEFLYNVYKSSVGFYKHNRIIFDPNCSLSCKTVKDRVGQDVFEVNFKTSYIKQKLCILGEKSEINNFELDPWFFGNDRKTFFELLDEISQKRKNFGIIPMYKEKNLEANYGNKEHLQA